MDASLVLMDLRQQFGNKSVLYSEDLAELLGRSVAAIEAMRARGGFPMPVIRVGGRPCVSIHAVAEFLAGEPSKAQQRPERAAPEGSARPIPKRHSESLSKYLFAMRDTRDFMFELDAAIERVILAMDVEKPDTPKDARLDGFSGSL